MKQFFLLLFFTLQFTSDIKAQKLTVGNIYYSPEVEHGYYLFSPVFSNYTFLIDECGGKINEWLSPYQAGFSSYLLTDGCLLRAGKTHNDSLNLAGGGGQIEKYDWDGNLIWSFKHSGLNFTQHHDIKPLPNGNILILGVEKKSKADALAKGRDPSKIKNESLYTEYILEVKPIGKDSGQIIWEWNVWDHLIQNINNKLPNFGVIEDHPELININFIGEVIHPDWMHANSIDYNEQEDKVMISFKKFNEIMIIDHSTTIEQSASHKGGKCNKGGDILFRWGNPLTYNSGTERDQKLFAQHNPNWIDKGFPYENNIIVFNNGDKRNYSSVDIISPETNKQGKYKRNKQNQYQPDSALWRYTANPDSSFMAYRISGASQLKNGNVLVCHGPMGKFFEVNNKGQIVWEYINPETSIGRLCQGDTVSGGLNQVFNCLKYSPDYLGLKNKDLTPYEPLEQFVEGFNEYNLSKIYHKGKAKKKQNTNPVESRPLNPTNPFGKSIRDIKR